MPATTARQQRFFGWLKGNPAEAARRGISSKVVDEFAHGPVGGFKQAGAAQPYDPNRAMGNAGTNIMQYGIGDPRSLSSLAQFAMGGPATPQGIGALPPEQAGARHRRGRQVGEAADLYQGPARGTLDRLGHLEPQDPRYFYPGHSDLEERPTPIRQPLRPDDPRLQPGRQGGARGRQVGLAEDAMPSEYSVGARRRVPGGSAAKHMLPLLIIRAVTHPVGRKSQAGARRLLSERDRDVDVDESHSPLHIMRLSF